MAVANKHKIRKSISKIRSAAAAKLLQSCPTVRPERSSPPGSSVSGILQARILEWVAISFSKGIFPTQGLNPGLLHCRQVLDL